MDNLPEDISRRELYQLFCWTGRINDIYLCRKQKNAMVYIFAFVRYTTKGGALKAIAEMNQFRLRGKIVNVGEAKFQRKVQAGAQRVVADTSRQLQRRPEMIIKETEVDKNPVEGEVKTGDQIHVQKGKGSMKRVQVPVVEANLKWLARSLVGYTLKPMELRSLQRIIHTNVPHVEDVREIGETKVLLTFDTVEHAAAAYTFKLDTMLQVFHRIRQWEESECGGSRRVWLECYGMPLHVWSSETFKAVGGLWGHVLHCAIPTDTGASFRVGRFQVDTCEFDEIREWVRIAIGESEISVFVKEMEREAGETGFPVEQKQVYEGGAVDGSGEHSRRKEELTWDPMADLIARTVQGGTMPRTE
ncbi:hypothetical protein AHAS_Ahas13G0174200 [Arachis hypogaea]